MDSHFVVKTPLVFLSGIFFNKNTSNGAYTIRKIIHKGDYVIIHVSKACMDTNIARKTLNIVIEKN